MRKSRSSERQIVLVLKHSDTGTQGNPIDFTVGEDGRIERIVRSAGGFETLLTYDGRGFLSDSRPPLVDSLIFFDDFETGDTTCWAPTAGCTLPTEEEVFTSPLYSSEGRLEALHFRDSTLGPEMRTYVFYFANRPVALLEAVDDGAGVLSGAVFTFVTTDHLGTPNLLADAAGVELWQGGFTPFGEDFTDVQGDYGLFLRLPGQWSDSTWAQSTMGASLYYNVHRWYEYGTGRYTKVDPLGRTGRQENLYAYTDSNPVANADPSGLQLVVPPTDPFVEAPGNRVPPSCSEGAWTFAGYEYRDRGAEALWQLVRALPIRIPRPPGAVGPKGTGGGDLGCLCEYALVGPYRNTEQWSTWTQTVTCPPCVTYERTEYRLEQVIPPEPQPFISPSWPKRRTWAPRCDWCPPNLF